MAVKKKPPPGPSAAKKPTYEQLERLLDDARKSSALAWNLEVEARERAFNAEALLDAAARELVRLRRKLGISQSAIRDEEIPF